MMEKNGTEEGGMEQINRQHIASPVMDINKIIIIIIINREEQDWVLQTDNKDIAGGRHHVVAALRVCRH